ncbi:hypothetical protein L207DRAFT_585277 [Hyaloscypha variabilis F]|uniref:Uncharacterized protein n=1 Tax=Hyaloscypha variabilis (strain UAMH 11265 / GT02V1 / F) TaxID=1149755 RepID=A0A2J6RIN3_HYAVF|nr:hypothetical protein L207DRAFT_585277 [Hyaloscypha variabilis F]
MEMVVPPLQKAGVYYLWPGLQDTGNTGVYQEVLDGRKGSWWIAPGWCCSNPNLPWGDGFQAPNGNTVAITMARDPSGPNWSSSMSMGSSKVKDSFPIAYKNFNQAILAIELNGVSWDFGKLVWNNITMVVNGTQTDWCTNNPENYNGATKFTITDAKAVTSGGSTTCTIAQIVMEGPADKRGRSEEVEYESWKDFIGSLDRDYY